MKSLMFLLTTVLCLLIGCRTDEDLGKYYEYVFSDSTFAVVSADSVHIILNQLPSSKIIPQVPFEVTEDSTLQDTLKFHLSVLFGSYTSTPNPWHEFFTSNDTLFFWYGYTNPLSKELATNTTTFIETSPKMTYYSVQSVLIRKSPNKSITFESKESE